MWWIFREGASGAVYCCNSIGYASEHEANNRLWKVETQNPRCKVWKQFIERPE